MTSHAQNTEAKKKYCSSQSLVQETLAALVRKALELVHAKDKPAPSLVDPRGLRQ